MVEDRRLARLRLPVQLALEPARAISPVGDVPSRILICYAREKSLEGSIDLVRKSMSQRIGRNDPCPCGSGKKYKRCCSSKDEESTKTEFKTIYRFEPGSYGDVGAFVPSLACLKRTQSDEWVYHFVLVKPENVFHAEDQAVAEAKNDISEAYKIKHIGGTDAELAMELKQKGYVSVDDFNVVGSHEFQA